MRPLTPLLVAAGLFLPQWAGGAELFPNSRYLKGKKGFPANIKGTIVVDEKELRFRDRQEQPVFAIPLEDVRSAQRIRPDQLPSWWFGVYGVLESSETDASPDLLSVEVKTKEGREIIVFETVTNRASKIASRIQFYRARASPESPSSPEP